ncbi:hypothetical protein [Solicola sp. PLA-1-18]|uniref:hypothetical protein n=1 Tax=Solicola sp. PLA-1-18 TaxID=3380532 RepID=UPI003B8078BE
MRQSRTPLRRRAGALALTLALAGGLAACTDAGDGTPSPSEPSSESTEGAVAQHETSTESPLGYGLSVPDGATQLGPLVRKRSPRVIEAFQGQLEEARQERAAEEARKRLESGEPSESATPSPSPSPSRDSFIELEDPPPADITTALLRVDGDPAEVLQELLAQLASVLPDNGIDPKNWSSYCRAENEVYTGCSLTQEGVTDDDQQLSVVISVDPGQVATGTAPPGAQNRPVMTVTLQNTADPTQIESDDPSPSVSPSPVPTPTPAPAVEGAFVEPTTTAPSTAGSPLLNDQWTVRDDTTLLLSGYVPGFAIMVADRDINADAIARSYVLPFSDSGAPTQDIVEDRNEISTTYTAQTTTRGLQVSATYIQSGRGNYVALFYSPPSS